MVGSLQELLQHSVADYMQVRLALPVPRPVDWSCYLNCVLLYRRKRTWGCHGQQLGVILMMTVCWTCL
jgi:hypothetical protein